MTLERALSRWRGWAFAIAAAALSLACGGGVGTGGTGDTPAVASGPITGFGSIIVAGTTFDDSDAVVRDDTGAEVARDGNELRLGMTVDVEGTVAGDGTGRAHEIRITSVAVGATSEIDAAAGTLRVAGQRLHVEAATVFDPALAGGMAALRPNQRVVVYGLPQAGRTVATRIEPAAPAAATSLAGVVSALDPAARTLRIGDTLVSYAQASGVPADLANGQVVRVRVAEGGTPRTVISFAAVAAPGDDGSRIELEGIATGVAGERFSVAGRAVDIAGARIEPDRAALADGVRVEVEGRVVGGVVDADRVKVFRGDEVDKRPYRVQGPIRAVDPAARTFVVRNITVEYAGAQFDGGTAAQLAVGVRVRAEGPLSPDRTRVRATRIEFR